MELFYSLTREDYLQYQLFASGQSARTRRNRLRDRYSLVWGAGVSALMLYVARYPLAASVFVAGAIIWFFAYPPFQRRRYYNHYKAYVDETFGATEDHEAVSLTISPENISLKSPSATLTVATSKLDAVMVVPGGVYFKTGPRAALIVPATVITDMPAFLALARQIAAANNIPYKEFPDWKWK